MMTISVQTILVIPYTDAFIHLLNVMMMMDVPKMVVMKIQDVPSMKLVVMMVMLVPMTGAIRPLLIRDADTLARTVMIMMLVPLIPAIIPTVANMTKLIVMITTHVRTMLVILPPDA